MKYLLDTTICHALLHGTDKTLGERFQNFKPSNFKLCSVVKSELFELARKSFKIEDNLLLLHKFFSQFDSCAFDDKAASFYGNILSQISTSDSDSSFFGSVFSKPKASLNTRELMIASIALSQDLILLTNNAKEFTKIPGLRFEMW